MWHGAQHKRKASGGRRRRYRAKKDFETGSFPAETKLGTQKRKVSSRRGGKEKSRLFAANKANVSDASGRTQEVDILSVANNPANVDYNRRGVITKGTLIETQAGTARVTSRPGQDGVVNAVLVSQTDK